MKKYNLIRLTFVIGILISFSSQAQRYIDHEIKLLHPSEQFTFVKGYYSDTIQLIYTNLGPDTLYSRADTIKISNRQPYSVSYDWMHDWIFNLDHDIPPGTSTILKFHYDFELTQDVDKLSHQFDCRVRSGGNLLGIGSVMPERQEHRANNGVTLYFHYRSATSSTAADEQTLTALKIYPNPVRDQLHLSTDIKSESQFEIYGLNGQVMLNGFLENQSIDVSALPAGLYFIKCKTEGGVAHAKFVKL